MILNLRDQLNLLLEWGFFFDYVGPSLQTAVAVHTDGKTFGQKAANQCFQDRIRLPQLPSLCASSFYFFFALTFLQIQFMPSFGGKEQRKMGLVEERLHSLQQGAGFPLPSTSSGESMGSKDPPYI